MTLTTPLEFVVPVVDDSIPQEPAGDADMVNMTGSPDTACPRKFFTVAVMVEVALPLADTDDGLAVTVTELGMMLGDEDVWVMVVLPLAPVWDSLAVMVQKPDVLDAV